MTKHKDKEVPQTSVDEATARIASARIESTVAKMSKAMTECDPNLEYISIVWDDKNSLIGGLYSPGVTSRFVMASIETMANRSKVPCRRVPGGLLVGTPALK